MPDTCGNPSCSVSRHPDNGKLFCAEIEIRGETEVRERTIAYVWLCDGCARQMRPESEIVGEITRVLLAQSSGSAMPISPAVN
jgi:hypothetical protein